MTQDAVTTSFDEQSVTDRLALGITAAPDPDAVLRTALHARAEGVAVFVPGASVDSETADLLGQFEVTVLEPSERAAAHREALVDAAEAQGCDGLLLCEAGTPIDFDASREALRETAAFSTTAITADTAASATPGRLVGIPAYNESVGIGSTILAAQQFADEVVVIDDGSADNTVELVRQTEATLLAHEENQGKGQALRTFFEYARASDHESFVVLDGDGQHLPHEVPDVVAPVEDGDADLVVGSRYLEGDGADETPFHRRVGQQVLDYLTFGSSGTKLTDTQSGFRAFSPTALDKLSIRTDGMGVESEMLTTAQDADLTIDEVPIDVRYEGIDGQTLNPLHHGLSVAAFLLQLIRDRHPLLFFGGPGVVIGAAGVVFGLDAVITFNDHGVFLLGQTMVGMLLTVIGLLGVFFGLVLNRMSNMVTELTEAKR